MLMKVGVLGASGYAGVELLRLCSLHPGFEVVVAGAEAYSGTTVGELYPSLGSAYPAIRFSKGEPASADGLDLLFLALPHGASQLMIGDLQERVGAIVDLAGDFRLADPSLYPVWYGAEHAAPDVLPRFAYGLPELNRDALGGRSMVAVAGCYPTAAGLALAPLARSGAIDTTGVVVDAASGVSGAGRGLSHSTHFGTANEDFRAYGLLDHRHTPEIEQVTGTRVIFTPHLAPMSRGILTTCYARTSGPTSTGEVNQLLRDTYVDEPFVSIVEDPPSTKATYGSNAAHVTARYDERTGWVLVLCSLDNLVKGAAGQAIQCANLALGLPEELGLTAVGVYP